MNRRIVFCGVILITLFGGCTAATSPHRTPPPSPGVTLPESATPTTEIPPTLTPFPPGLTTNTDPYFNAGALLDGACFEYLLTLNGQVWTWATPADLNAFYDRVDGSELCLGPVARADFDFSRGILAGTVSAATGCDAAHRIVDIKRDDGARTQTLFVELDVKSGCPYELVQPLLIAVPDLPGGYTLQMMVTARNEN